MNYFPKTAYWRPLVPNAESMDKTTNKSVKNTSAPYVAENEAEFGLVKKSICSNIPVFTTTSKNMKKFVSETFKPTRSGKTDAEEPSHIEVCVNPNIQEKNNLTHKTSSVGYADMLLPLTKIFRVKNKCCPVRNWISGKI